MGAGHASTSIGYAVGLKEGMRLRGEPDAGKVVAVIGDGAMTGGVAFEAIHQAGGLGTPIVVVLNDNGMSIAPNVGALSRYFNRVRLNPKLWHAREGVEEQADRAARRHRRGLRAPRPAAQGVDQGLLGAGPASGRSSTGPTWASSTATTCARLRRALREALAADRPVVVHIATVKGKGFAPAEEGGLEGMEKWHAAKPEVDRQPRAAVAVRSPRRGTPRRRSTRRSSARRWCDEVRRDRARRRDHRRDELRHRAEHPAEGRARPLLRRRHRRAAGGALRRRARARGRQAGVRDLLDLPAARLRPDRPRRLPAEAQRRLRDGPRRARRRRRPDAPRRLRHRLPALPAEHRAHGPARRGDARAHAAHRADLRRRPVRAALPARRGRRRRAAAQRRRAIEIGRGEILREGDARRARRLRQRRAEGARGRRPAGRGRPRRHGRRRALRQAARRARC